MIVYKIKQTKLTMSKFGSRKMAGTFEMFVKLEDDVDGGTERAGEAEAR